MKKIGLLIFVFGIFLDAGAFLISNSEQFNFVYSIVAPSYVKGKSAIEIIENTGELNPESVEFEICKDLYIESIKHDNPDYDLTGITIVRLHHPPSISHGWSVKKGANIKRPLDVYLSNGFKYESSIEALQKKVDRLKKNKLSGSATLLFLIGTILTVVGFAIEYSKSNNP